jgi:proteasome accessory factor B
MSRIERLLNLTAALLHTERALSAEELQERVPGYPDDKTSFRRQFERDKDALRDLGLPLSVEQLKGAYADQQVGYRIMQDQYYLPDPGLSPDELAAIHLAARVVRVDGIASGDVAWKLGAPRPGEETDDDQQQTTVVPANERLATLFQCISEGRTATFLYKDELRDVEPEQLSFRNGHWYLLGFDRTRNDARSFRIDRIDGAVQPGDKIRERGSSTRVSQLGSHPWELGDGEAISALIRIGAAQALWARAHLGESTVVRRDDDGSMVFALQVRNVDAFRSFVLGFLDRAEILEPAALRDEMIAWLDQLIDATI